MAVGDSIAVNGVCLTVIARNGARFRGRRVAGDAGLHRRPRAGRRVNLEKALRLADRLGGHLVSGHVDGVGRDRVKRVGANRVADGQAPRELAKYIARKGSITVNGVSLTVNG